MSQTADATEEATPEHDPCCSAHGIPMGCERYRRTHFVEVRPCCSIDAKRIEEEAYGSYEQGCTEQSCCGGADNYIGGNPDTDYA